MWVLRAKQLWLTTPPAMKSPVPVVMSNIGTSTPSGSIAVTRRLSSPRTSSPATEPVGVTGANISPNRTRSRTPPSTLVSVPSVTAANPRTDRHSTSQSTTTLSTTSKVGSPSLPPVRGRSAGGVEQAGDEPLPPVAGGHVGPVQDGARVADAGARILAVVGGHRVQPAAGRGVGPGPAQRGGRDGADVPVAVDEPAQIAPPVSR